MNILITGAGGFLAKHLIELILTTTGHNVIALTSKCTEVKAQWKEYGERLSTIFNSELHKVEWKEVDVLVNCAFPRNSDGVEMAKGLKYISDVLVQAVDNGIESVISISSQSVYSQKREEAADESTELNLETNYAVGKYASELLINSICRNIRHTNIRMASLIGPEFEQRLVNKFVNLAMNGNDLNIQGTQQFFGFMDVKDAANAVLKVIEDAGEWEEVYNLGVKDAYSIVEVAEKIKEVVNQGISITILENDICFNSEMEAKMFYERFNFLPQITIEQSIKSICDYLDKKGIK